VLAFVVYAGIAGSGAARVDGQVGGVLRDLAVEPVALSDADRRTLARRGDGATEVIHRLHTDGVVVGEVVRSAGHGAVLRLLMYDAAGRRKDFLEVPLSGDALADADLQTIGENVRADYAELLQIPEIVPTPPEPPPPGPGPVPAPPPPPETIATHEQPEEPPLHLQLVVGLGVLARTFAPGPPALLGYRSGPVGVIGLDAQVEPAGPLSLGAHVERSLTMSTRIAGVDVATAVTRWQLGAAWSFRPSAGLALAPTLAIGRRTFTVESKDPTRSPDADYTYLGAGLRLTLRHGALTAMATAAFEPVLGDEEATEMSFGPTRIFALDAAVDVGVRLSSVIFLRAEASVQRFWWTWPDAGARGAGGAQDTYPGAGGWIGFRY
jgi:hypothetical protein